MIFGIGLSKTGTTSLNEALCLLGIRSLHYPDPALMLEHRFEEALAGYEGATDITVSMCFEALDRAYPGSRFILTTRDREAWLASLARHMRRRHFDETTPRGNVRRRLLGTDTFDRNAMSDAFDRFNERVDIYFTGRSNDLLRLNVCSSPEGWEVLCPFLGRPVPDVAFPRLNVAPAPSA